MHALTHLRVRALSGSRLLRVLPVARLAAAPKKKPASTTQMSGLDIIGLITGIPFMDPSAVTCYVTVYRDDLNSGTRSRR